MNPNGRHLLLSLSSMAVMIGTIDICQRFAFGSIMPRSNNPLLTARDGSESSRNAIKLETQTLKDLPLATSLLSLPENITTVFINIGSSLDPILPPVEFGHNATTIAFEPIVGCDVVHNIPKSIRNQLMVVHAAVAATSGLTSMNVYNRDGVSSSLSKAATVRSWNSDAHRDSDGSIRIVPLLTIEQILNAIPAHVDIPYIKTDMQGYDFAAIAAAGHTLFQRGVDYLFTEAYFLGESSYEGVQNDFCDDWWPHMQRVGYKVVNSTKFTVDPRENDTLAVLQFCEAQERRRRRHHRLHKNAGLYEGDVLWKRIGAPDRVFQFRSLAEAKNDS